MSMRIVTSLLAILMMLLAGMGLTLALWRGKRAILITELVGWGWLLGAGVVSLLLALAGIVIPGGALMIVVAVACLGLGAFGIQRLRKGQAIESGLAGTAAWEKWLSLLVLLPIVYMAYATFRDALLWDGLVIWETKARSAFLAGGSLPASYFSDVTRARYHPSYPLYLPFTELWIYLWVGDADQAMVKLIFPIFYVAAVLLLWSSVLRLTGRICVAVATSILPLFVPLMADHGLGLVEGYADFPLGIVYLAGLSALLAWRLKGLEGGWPLACACAALLPWIKQEGLLLLASLIGVAALVHGWSGWRRTILFALPGVVVLLGWKVAMHFVHVVNESVFQPVTAATAVKNLPRLWPILQAMEFQLTQFKNWSLLWYAVPVALVCVAWRHRALAMWLGAALLVPLAFDILPYYFTSLDLLFHITTSFDRLALQISLVAVLCLGLALGRPEPAPDPANAADGNTGGDASA